MNVGNDRHVAAALAQTAHNMLQIRCVFHRRRGDADYLAASRGQFHRLRDGRFRVHGVAGDHRLHANRIFTANPDAPDLYLARHPPLICKWIGAVASHIRWRFLVRPAPLFHNKELRLRPA